MRTKPVLRKSPSPPTASLPVLEHVQAYQRQLHFWRIAVVHANQRGGASASALADMAFVDDYDLSRLSFREVECDRGAHHTCAENHDVGVSLEAGTWNRFGTLTNPSD